MGRRKETTIFIQRRKPRLKGILLWMAAFLTLLTGVFLVGNDVYTRDVRMIRQPVSVLGLPKELEGFTILHISDLHGARLGEDQARIAAALGKLPYNVVCITGDMVGESGDVRPFLELLSLLKKDVPILFIAGDCDPPPALASAHDTLSVLAPYILAAQQAGAVYLDAPYPIPVGKTTVWFSPEGLYSLDADGAVASSQSQLDRLNASDTRDTPDGAAQARFLEYRIDAAQRLKAARTQMKNGDLHVALSHAPLTYEYVRQVWGWQEEQGPSMQKVTLALAGHLCAGQWRLPGMGAVWVPELGFFPEDRLITGLGRVSTIAQYISPGLGASCHYPLIKARLFNPPALTLLSLTAKPQ